MGTGPGFYLGSLQSLDRVSAAEQANDPFELAFASRRDSGSIGLSASRKTPGCRIQGCAPARVRDYGGTLTARSSARRYPSIWLPQHPDNPGAFVRRDRAGRKG